MFKRENVFVRNKKPLPLKIQSVVDYTLGISYRKISNKLRFLFGVSIAISAIHKWVKKFQSKIAASKRERCQIAIDETVIKSRDKRFYIWSAIDLETGELVAYDVSAGRTHLDTIVFLVNYRYWWLTVGRGTERQY